MKKRLSLFLALLLLCSSVAAYAQQEETIEMDASDAAEEVEWAEIQLTPYDYDDIVVGNPTPLNGKFFTEMWGNGTSDIDVRYLVSGYDLVTWDDEASYFRFDRSVVSGALVNADEAGNRTYLLALASNLYYSDGTPVTAWDYAFSVLLQGSPLISELGAHPAALDYLLGYEDYFSGAAPGIAGLRVQSDNLISFTVKAEALPYFYELSYLSFCPYPIHAIAPGCIVRDDGAGAYIASDPEADGEGFTAELLRRTILDSEKGYQSHPDPVSGPYRLISFDGDEAVFEINRYYKGNEEGKKPRIKRITYRRAANDSMIRGLAEGEYALLNKVTQASAVTEGLNLCAENPQYTRAIYPRIGLTYIFFNPQSRLVQQQNVRQAIAGCLDSDQLIGAYVGNFGLKANALYGLGQWMYQAATGMIDYPAQLSDAATQEETAAYEKNEAAWDALTLDGLTLYPLDTEAAAALLEQAGWTLNSQGEPFEAGTDSVRCREADGQLETMELTMGYLSGGSMEQTFNDAFVKNLAAAGVSLKLVPLHFDSIAQSHADRALEGVDMIYMGDNFNISFDPALFFVDDEQAQEADSLRSVYGELFDLAREMDRTQPGAILEYMQKWVRFQERFSQLLPMIPVYTNIYYDFYTKELDGYWIAENTSWGQAIVPARMHSLKQDGMSATDVSAEISGMNGEAELDLSILAAYSGHEDADRSDGVLSHFPEEIRRQVPGDYQNIYEFVAGQVPEEVQDEDDISIVYAFQTAYSEGEKVYLLFGIREKGSDVEWFVREGVGLEDGRVSVTLEKEQWEKLKGITFALAVVSK